MWCYDWYRRSRNGVIMTRSQKDTGIIILIFLAYMLGTGKLR